jgi:hypothetical protein
MKWSAYSPAKGFVTIRYGVGPLDFAPPDSSELLAVCPWKTDDLHCLQTFFSGFLLLGGPPPTKISDVKNQARLDQCGAKLVMNEIRWERNTR